MFEAGDRVRNLRSNDIKGHEGIVLGMEGDYVLVRFNDFPYMDDEDEFDPDEDGILAPIMGYHDWHAWHPNELELIVEKPVAKLMEIGLRD